MILSDLGGEALNKLSPLSQYIPNNKLKFSWSGNFAEYQFKAINNKCTITNTSLKVDAKSLFEEHPLNAMGFDVCMLLLYGGLSVKMNFQVTCVKNVSWDNI